jgi:hypothetical protein
MRFSEKYKSSALHVQTQIKALCVRLSIACQEQLIRSCYRFAWVFFTRDIVSCRSFRTRDRCSGDACLNWPRHRIALVIAPSVTPPCFLRACSFGLPRKQRRMPGHDPHHLSISDLTRPTHGAWHRAFPTSPERDRSPPAKTSQSRRTFAPTREALRPPVRFRRSQVAALPYAALRPSPLPDHARVPGALHREARYLRVNGDLARISFASASVACSTSRRSRSKALASRLFPVARSSAAFALSARHFSSAFKTSASNF